MPAVSTKASALHATRRAHDLRACCNVRHPKLSPRPAVKKVVLQECPLGRDAPVRHPAFIQFGARLTMAKARTTTVFKRSGPGSGGDLAQCLPPSATVSWRTQRAGTGDGR